MPANNMLQMGQPAMVASTALNADSTAVITTFTQQVTQAQLNQALAQANLNLVNAQNAITSIEAQIGTIKSQLALFTGVSQAQATGTSN